MQTIPVSSPGAEYGCLVDIWVFMLVCLMSIIHTPRLISIIRIAMFHPRGVQTGGVTLDPPVPLRCTGGYYIVSPPRGSDGWRDLGSPRSASLHGGLYHWAALWAGNVSRLCWLKSKRPANSLSCIPLSWPFELQRGQSRQQELLSPGEASHQPPGSHQPPASHQPPGSHQLAEFSSKQTA